MKRGPCPEGAPLSVMLALLSLLHYLQAVTCLSVIHLHVVLEAQPLQAHLCVVLHVDFNPHPG